MHKVALNARERRRLREGLGRCRDARLYQRVLALLEADAGRPVAQGARRLGVTRPSVHNWLRAYRELPRRESLHERPRRFRPCVLPERLREELRVLMDQSPRELGYLANAWTVPLLREHLRHEHGQECAARTVRRELHAMGYPWKRARYTLAPDPDGEKKRKVADFCGEWSPAASSSPRMKPTLRLFPPLRASWSRRGHPQKVELSGSLVKRVLLGAINIRTGHRLKLIRPSQRGDDFRTFLELVHHHYRAWHVVMLLDEDTSHTAGASQELAVNYDIRLTWLPKRSPHLNPVDHLWRHAKAIKSRVEELVAAKIVGDTPDRDTLLWVKSLDDRLHRRLSSAGLIPPRDTGTLMAFVEAFISGRPEVNGSPAAVWRRARNHLQRFFGDERLLREITVGDAKDFRRYLLTTRSPRNKPLSDETVRQPAASPSSSLRTPSTAV